MPKRGLISRVEWAELPKDQQALLLRVLKSTPGAVEGLLGIAPGKRQPKKVVPQPLQAHVRAFQRDGLGPFCWLQQGFVESGCPCHPRVRPENKARPRAGEES